MAEPVKKDDALAAAVREAFQRHMENARLAAQNLKDRQGQPNRPAAVMTPPKGERDSRLKVPEPANSTAAPLPEVPADAASQTLPADIIRLATVRPEVPSVAAKAEQPANKEISPAAPGFAADEAYADIEAAAEPSAVSEQHVSVLNQEEIPQLPEAAALQPTEDKADSDARLADEVFSANLTKALLHEIAPDTVEGDHQQQEPTFSTPEHARKRVETRSEAPIELFERQSRLQPAYVQNKRTTSISSATDNKPHTNGRVRSKRIRSKVIGLLVITTIFAAGGALAWTHRDKIVGLVHLIVPTPPKVERSAAIPVIPAVTARNEDRAQPPAGSAQPSPAADASRSVTTVTIKLDAVDQTIQNARELAMIGDIEGARATLSAYSNRNDARILFALAETFDPSIIRDPSKTDAARAKSYYEAAASSGASGTEERLARLNLAN